MHAIDEIRRDVFRRHTFATPPLTPEEADPVVFIFEESVWTLGMVESIWQYLIDQSHAELFVRRRRERPHDDIPF